jgi:predicted hydrocarbon binding protein
VLDRWWSPLAQAGWGTVTLDVSSLSRGFAFIELRHSTVVAALAGPNRATEPLCHLYAGLFAGALSFFERAERHGVEIQCAALGAPACRFAVGPGSQIDEVEMWRKQGIAPDEIRRRLT